MSENKLSPADIQLLSDEDKLHLQHLLEKARPLLALKRFDNIVDLLSLISDSIDIIDNATVEKLSVAFEETLIPVWELSTAYNMAKKESLYQDKKYTLGSTFALLKNPDTLKGISIILRTVQIIGENNHK
ncbi:MULTISPECIES: hypothetical protein [Proteus]|uniref:DUF1641 domain-containing protein n=1 Tax=Proteus penneri TaxID=102862 RepID=A0ABS0W255_9GAMM|nr:MULTISPECIES: hypothetical protein [Proteus]MBJ2117386.1 hypothetical protein [Proteus penneri]NBM11785.1 hypothetical protein [Proteus sp. G2670]NBM31989.1 hypothetical protein [Proteus sp. G2664]NBM67603.1 hypothetical protein [Proteus sp. G2663]NBM86467.1 hypothetical protein [Proteus sp. G2661]